MASLHARLGRLSAALPVNSILCFEGVARHLARFPEAEVAGTALGCFASGPFAALSRFPVTMLRQRADAVIEGTFARLDAGALAPSLDLVAPVLMA